MVKKVEAIKKALEVSKKCYDAVKANIRVGVSEKEIYDIVAKTIKNVGGGHCKEFIGDFVCGERTGDIGGDPTDKKMKLGDLFILDLSVKYDDYWCDTCRTFFLGEPTLEQRKAYDVIIRAQYLGKLVARNGIQAQSIKKVMEEFMISQGFGGMMPHHAGHSVGEKPFQDPVFEAGCDKLIQKGDIITLEPGLYVKNKWGIRVENDYIVQNDYLEDIFIYNKKIEDFIIYEEENRK